MQGKLKINIDFWRMWGYEARAQSFIETLEDKYPLKFDLDMTKDT